jgi:hypothetical protein
MFSNREPIRWTNPEYVAAGVGVLTVGAFVFYSAHSSGPTVDEIIFVGLVIMLPATLAYELARRFQ